MKATEQYFPVVLFIINTIQVGFNLNDWTKSKSLTVLIKVLLVLFIILCEKVLTFEFLHVDEIWTCNHSDKSYRVLIFCTLALSAIVRYKMILTLTGIKSYLVAI